MAMQAGLMRIAPVNDGQGEPCFYDDEGFVAWLEGEGGLERDAGDIVYLGDNSIIDSYEGQYRFAPDQSLGRYTIAHEVSEEDDASSAPIMEEEELFAPAGQALVPCPHSIRSQTRACSRHLQRRRGRCCIQRARGRRTSRPASCPVFGRSCSRRRNRYRIAAPER